MGRKILIIDYRKLESFLGKLKNEGLTLAFAESMTAGLLFNEFSKRKRKPDQESEITQKTVNYVFEKIKELYEGEKHT